MSLEIQWPGIGSLIPAHAELIEVDSIFGKGPNVLNKLNQGIEEMNTGRTILIDCCPFLGVLSLNAIFAADRMLVPVSSDFLSLRGALQIEHTLKALEPVLKRRMERRYVLTRYDRRRKMSSEILDRMRRQFGSDVCASVITENVAVAEAPAFSRAIFFASGIKPRRERQCRVDGRADQLRVCLTRNQAGDVSEAAASLAGSLGALIKADRACDRPG